MTQVFDEDGSVIPVTVVELLPMTVTQVKTIATDGYNAVQVGIEPAKEKHLSRPEQGHFKKNGLPLFRTIREFRLEDVSGINVGDTLTWDDLKSADTVTVVGHSIGKGFQGRIARWNQHRGPMSHGSKSHRIPGSSGAGTTPGRVLKGKKMAGKTGNERVTIKGLRVVKVYEDRPIVLIKGALPGVEQSLVTLCPVAAKAKSAS
jgi:large subunit ribosomal protein L3